MNFDTMYGYVNNDAWSGFSIPQSGTDTFLTPGGSSTQSTNIFEIDKPNPLINIRYWPVSMSQSNILAETNADLGPFSQQFCDIYINDVLYLSNLKISMGISNDYTPAGKGNAISPPYTNYYFTQSIVIPTSHKITKVTIKNFHTQAYSYNPDSTGVVEFVLVIIPLNDDYAVSNPIVSDITKYSVISGNSVTNTPANFKYFKSSSPYTVRWAAMYDQDLRIPGSSPNNIAPPCNFYLSRALTRFSPDDISGLYAAENSYLFMNVYDNINSYMRGKSCRSLIYDYVQSYPISTSPGGIALIIDHKGYAQNNITNPGAVIIPPLTMSDFPQQNPEYSYFSDLFGIGVDKPVFFDSYGRVVRQPASSDTTEYRWLKNNYLVESLSITTGEKIKYKKIQSWWSGPSISGPPPSNTYMSSNLPDDTLKIRFEDDYIFVDNKVFPNQYTFYIVTENGHTQLNINVEGGSDYEVSYLLYRDVPYVISMVGDDDLLPVNSNPSYVDPYDSTGYQLISTVSAITNEYGYNKPSVAGNVVLLKSNKNIKFKYSGITFNITVIEKLTNPKEIEIPFNTSKSLSELFNIDSSIPQSAIDFYQTAPALIPIPFNTTTFVNIHSPYPFVGGSFQLKIYNQPVQNMTVVNISANATTIFEKTNRVINLKEHVTITGSSVPENYTNFVFNTNFTVNGNAGNNSKIKFNQTNSTIEILTDDVTLIDFDITVNGAVISVTFQVVVIDANAKRYQTFQGGILQLTPDGSNTDIFIVDKRGNRNKYLSVPTPPLVFPIENDSFSLTFSGGTWSITILEEIYIQCYKTGGGIREILASPVPSIPNILYISKKHDNSGEIYINDTVEFDLYTNNLLTGSFKGKYEIQNISNFESYYQLKTKYYKSTFASGTLVRNPGSEYVINIKVIQATTIIVPFVKTNSIAYNELITSVGNLPNFVTNGPGNVLTANADRLTSPNYDEQILIKSIGNDYGFIKFLKVDKVDTVQEIYYTDNDKYEDILDLQYYSYYTDPIKNAADAMTIDNGRLTSSIPYTGAYPVLTVYFRYAELVGQIKLIKFTGTSTVKKFYSKLVIDDVESVKLSPNSKKLVFPYVTASASIDLNISTNKLTITRSTPSIFLNELFIKKQSDNSLYLCSFQNINPIIVNDIYLYNKPTWTSQIPLKNPTNGSVTPFSLLTGTTLTPASGATKVHVEIDTTSTVTYAPYGDTYVNLYTDVVFGFDVYFISDNHTKQSVLLGTKESISITSSTLKKYGTDLTNMMDYQFETIINSTHTSMDVQADRITFHGLSVGTSRYFIVQGDQCLVYDVSVLSPPLFGEITIETIENIGSSSNLYDFPPTVNGLAINSTGTSTSSDYIYIQSITHQGQTSPSSTLQLKSGKNTIMYTVKGVPSISPYLSFVLNLSIIERPKTFDSARTFKLGSKAIKIDLVNEIFGETNGNSIVLVSNSNNTPTPAITINADGNGDMTIDQSNQLSTVSPYNPLSDIIIDKSGKFITVSVKDTGDVTTYNFVITFEVTTKSEKYLKAQVTAKISFTVWDPNNISKIFIYQVPNSTVVSHAYQNLGIIGTFASIENNGVVLDGFSHNALNWEDKNDFKVKSKTQTVDSYFLRTSDNNKEYFYYLSVIVLKAPAEKTFYIANGVPRVLDLINEFFPLYGDKLIDAGIDNITALQNFNLTYSMANSSQTQYVTVTNTGSASIAIFTLTCIFMPLSFPTLIENEIEFVIPIKTSHDIKISDISPNAETIEFVPIDSSSDISIFKKDDKTLTVFSTAASTLPYSFGVRLSINYLVTPIDTNTDPNVISIPSTGPSAKKYYIVKILFYDPSISDVVTKTTYFSTFKWIFRNKVAKSYVMNGVTYLPTNTVNNAAPVSQPNFVSVVNNQTNITNTPTTNDVYVSVSKSQFNDHNVIVIRTEDGLVSILDVKFITPAAVSKKYYVIPNGTSTISLADISNFSYQVDPSTGETTPVTVFSFDDSYQYAISPPTSITPTMLVDINQAFLRGSFYEFENNSGTVVGKILTSAIGPTSGQITIEGVEPGIWNDIHVDIKVTHINSSGNPTTLTLLRVKLTIETIQSLVIVPNDIPVEIGSSINFDLRDFIHSGINDVVFKGWSFNGNPGIPAGFSITNYNFMTTTPLIVKNIYNVAASVLSTFTSSVNAINFNIIVYDTEDASTQRVHITLIEDLAYELSLPVSVTTVNDQKFSSQTTIDNKVKISTITGGIRLRALSKFTDTFTITLLTSNGIYYFLDITQANDEKNITIEGFEYSGNVFKNTGQTVTGYTTSDNVAQKNTGTLYSVVGGTIIIENDGSYSINCTQSLTVNVNTSQSRIITITHQGNQHPIRKVTISPPSEFSLGKNPTGIIVNGLTHLESSLTLSYATLSVTNGVLKVTDVKFSTFSPTLIQYENILDNSITVMSMILDISRTISNQVTTDAIPNSNVTIVLEFEPTKVTYDGMDLTPDESIDFFRQGDGVKLGTVITDGTSVKFTTLSNTGVSEPIGFYNTTTDSHYYIRLNITQVQSTSVLPGDTLTTNTYTVIGLLDGTTVYPGNTLSNKVQFLSNGTLVILDSSISGDFIFYGITTLNVFKLFVIRYIHDTISVRDKTKILTAAFLRGESGPIEFATGINVSVVGNLVMNPDSLSIITTTKPFNGRFTIELIPS